jgi:S1-C subfamily serine protease
MITHIGPNQKEEFIKLSNSFLNNTSKLFWIIFIALPIIIYIPFNYYKQSSATSIIFDTNVKTSSNIIEAVAKVKVADGSIGSAFLVSDYYLITANHVVESFNLDTEVDVIFEKKNMLNRTAIVAFKGGDFDRDFAILKLSEPVNIMPIQLGTSYNAKINSHINVIGYPAGLFSSTVGIISNDNILENPAIFQIDAGAWLGNSGGPIILKNTGEAIGILTMGFDKEYQGMVFGVKIDALLNDREFQRSGIRF